VNATTVTSSCGLLPNVTYSRDGGVADASLGNGKSVAMVVSSPCT
jgi:hypothetical protein